MDHGDETKSEETKEEKAARIMKAVTFYVNLHENLKLFIENKPMNVSFNPPKFADRLAATEYRGDDRVVDKFN